MPGPTDFETWFSADFNRLIQNVPADPEALSNGLGIQFASWDRRAAYLLWSATGRPRAKWVEQMAPLYARKPAADEEIDLLAGAGVEEELDLLA